MKTAVRIAVIVGTLLVIINYGDRIFLGSMHSNDWFKVFLTYMVPFFVSSYSSAKAEAASD
jgi:hypothetical protein